MELSSLESIGSWSEEVHTVIVFNSLTFLDLKILEIAAKIAAAGALIV